MLIDAIITVMIYALAIVFVLFIGWIIDEVFGKDGYEFGIVISKEHEQETTSSFNVPVYTATGVPIVNSSESDSWVIGVCLESGEQVTVDVDQETYEKFEKNDKVGVKYKIGCITHNTYWVNVVERRL